VYQGPADRGPLLHSPGKFVRVAFFEPFQPHQVQEFHRRIHHLLHREPTVKNIGDGYELDLAAMPLSSDAKDAWIDFHDEVELAQGPGESLEHARAFASKAAEHAARIAGVIQIVTNPTPGVVDKTSMVGGIEVARFYLGEHVRLTGAGTEERRNGLLHALAHWLGTRGGVVPHKDVLQRAPNPVRLLKADGINELLAELGNRHYIRRIGDGWEVRQHV